MTREQKEKIATSNGVKLYFVYQVLSGSKYTTIPGLAIDLAKFTGKKPIDYFNPRKKHLRKFAIEAYPEFDKKFKKVSA